jgi:transposase InsO family protein
VLRLMREHGLLAHQRTGAPRGSRAHDGTITTQRVDLMWGSDLTSVMTGEGQAAVFVAVDHCSAECVGIHASRRADRFEALEPIRQAVRERLGAFAKDIARGLALRHDHGSQYLSHHFQAEIRFLGIESSPAFVREPEGNGCAERFIRVLKENLLWVRRFATVEELRLALQAFKELYNQTWIIERHGYKSPAQVRADQIGRMPMAA